MTDQYLWKYPWWFKRVSNSFCVWTT